MIWGYRNSLKAWQLWNMKKPHHIKGCEINFSAEIIWNKIKNPRCFIISMPKLVCWLISCLTQRKCWKLRIVERPLDIFSASANCFLDTNFTFRTLRTRPLECNWHTLSIIRHPTSHSAVAFISPVWHSDTDFTFSFRADLLSAVDTNFSHFSLAGTSESGFLKFEKWKVKTKSFHSFSRSAKWNQNAFTLFWEVKSEIKMLRDRDREVKILENSEQISRNEIL